MTADHAMLRPALVLLALIVFTGCGRANRSHGVASGSSSWTIASEDPLPGVDHGSINVTTLKCGSPQGVTVVIWSDLPNGGRQSANATSDLAWEEGHHVGAGGRRIGFRSETRDGLTASVAIDGSPFDTSNGRLFLVSTQGETPQVLQLKADVAEMPRDGEGLKEFAARHAEIEEFFTKAKAAGNARKAGDGDSTD